jgi:AcrR family transcriptional regulator
LIVAGIVCLGKGGMSAFTIDHICRQAGVSRGLINHHFVSKDDLLVSIYAHMTDYLMRDSSGLSPRQQISGFIDSSFDKNSFKKSNLRAWLAIWGEVVTNPNLKALHQSRSTAPEQIPEVQAATGLRHNRYRHVRYFELGR